MRKTLIFLFLLFILLTTDVQAQGPIYLPLIFGNGELTMSGLATLEITDGTTTINLLTKEGQTGFHLISWRPQIIQPKDGGVYQDSDIAPGRDLVFAVDGTANEIFNTHLNGNSQDQLIQTAQDLLRLLTKARNYSLSKWQDTPVYIKAQASCETNVRYALIKNFTIQDVDDPYNQPFTPTAGKLIAMQNIAIGIEREHWLSNAPSTGACAEISSYQEFAALADWTLNTAAPVDFVRAMIQAANGDIYAGDDTGQIWRSQDNGTNWAVNTVLPAAEVYCFLQAANDYIYAGGSGEILRTIDNGANWTSDASPVGAVGAMIQLANGDILAAEEFQIWRSQDNGASWAVVATGFYGEIHTLLQLTNGWVLAGDRGQIWRSKDNGVTWSLVNTAPTDEMYGFVQLTNGSILVGDNNHIWRSDDNGDSWYIAYTGGSFVFDIIQTTQGDIYASQDGQVLVSSDNGLTWVVSTTDPVNEVYSLLQITVGYIFAGESGQIWWFKPYTVYNMGAVDTCEDIAYIASKQNLANITNIYINDGGVFSANLFPMIAFPTTLLPAVPVVNDAIYFGIDTSIDNSGPFTSLVFDIATPARSTTSYTITWEYSNGAAGWPALTVRDGTNAGIGALSNLGVNSVHWTPPATFAAEAVNGVTGYWVRARVSALVGTLTPPTQQNRNIYSVVNGYTEIASTEVLGDIPALAQILAHNRSDQDGPGGSGPDLYANRLIVGLRSYDRGPTFQAYLNAADEQNPFGITVSVGTNTTIGNDIYAPTGRSATYNPGGVEAMATRVTFAFGPTIARDYYGSFHAFLRVYRDAGASTDFDVRLQVVNGSGGVSYTTDTQQIATTTRFEILDFGLIRLPASGSLGLDELGDTSEIRVQASAASGVPNLVIYDLILMPVDEFCVDSNDKTNSAYSDIGRSSSIDKFLNIDSITKPKYPIRSVVQRYGSNLVTSIYNSVTPGEAILQANVQQRLWFFSMKTSATGTSYSWIAPPEIAYSLQVYKNERYLSMRGDR